MVFQNNLLMAAASTQGGGGGGQLWTWGDNLSGQLGQGTTSWGIYSPVQVGSDEDWLTPAPGAGDDSASNGWSAIIKDDGSLWAWGANNWGQLGDGSTTDRSSPVQVGSLTDWFFVACGDQGNTLAVKTDGTLWSWGRNYYGELGLGDTTSRSSPVQVGSLTDWNGMDEDDLKAGTPIKLIMGEGFAMVIKSDSTLWSMGNNNAGQLGLGDTTNRSSPVQVGSLTDWNTLGYGGRGNTSAAIKTDGTLWTWGKNDFGAQGHSDTTTRSSPVQVGSLTDWKSISAGYAQNYSAVKTDGTLWAWGRQTALLNDDTTSRSSPIQIGSDTDWDITVGGDGLWHGWKTDNTLYASGSPNNHGELGIGNGGTGGAKSSPVQVGSDTDWTGRIMGGADEFRFTIRGQ